MSIADEMADAIASETDFAPSMAGEVARAAAAVVAKHARARAAYLRTVRGLPADARDGAVAELERLADELEAKGG